MSSSCRADYNIEKYGLINFFFLIKQKELRTTTIAIYLVNGLDRFNWIIYIIRHRITLSLHKPDSV